QVLFADPGAADTRRSSRCPEPRPLQGFPRSSHDCEPLGARAHGAGLEDQTPHLASARWHGARAKNLTAGDRALGGHELDRPPDPSGERAHERVRRRHIFRTVSLGSVAEAAASASWFEHLFEPVPHVMHADRDVVDLTMMEAALLALEDLEGLVLGA